LTTIITVNKRSKQHKTVQKFEEINAGKTRKSEENKEKRRKSKIFTVFNVGGEGEI
jgi:hypothetical protein